MVKRHQVYFIGAANLDETIRLTDQLQPSASNPAHWTYSVGGVASNACRAAALVQADSLEISLVAPLANDETGRRIRDTINQLPIETHFVEIEDAASSRYTAVQDITGELVLGLAETDIAERLTASTISPLLSQRHNTIVFDTNLSASTIAELVARTHTNMKIGLAVSPAKSTRLLHVASSIDLIFLNRLEVASLTGLSAQAPLENHAIHLFNLGFQRFVITDGAHPLLIGCDESVDSVSPTPLNTLHQGVNGLGDAFAGATIAALLHKTANQAGSSADLMASIRDYGLPACQQLIQ